MKISDYVINTLAAEGVTHIFEVCGGHWVISWIPSTGGVISGQFPCTTKWLQQ